MGLCFPKFRLSSNLPGLVMEQWSWCLQTGLMRSSRATLQVNDGDTFVRGLLLKNENFLRSKDFSFREGFGFCGSVCSSVDISPISWTDSVQRTNIKNVYTSKILRAVKKSNVENTTYWLLHDAYVCIAGDTTIPIHSLVANTNSI